MNEFTGAMLGILGRLTKAKKRECERAYAVARDVGATLGVDTVNHVDEIGVRVLLAVSLRGGVK
jgi:hypothetical protein